jgi:hypothetical protein
MLQVPKALSVLFALHICSSCIQGVFRNYVQKCVVLVLLHLVYIFVHCADKLCSSGAKHLILIYVIFAPCYISNCCRELCLV